MISSHDRIILRELAQRVAEIAALPCMAERRAQWKRHHALRPGRPMLLVFPEGSWMELVPESSLQCTGREARDMEAELRRRVYVYEHLHSDNVIDREWTVQQVFSSSGWGIEPRRHASSAQRGAWSFDPVITTPADLRKLRFPEIRYDEEATQRSFAQAQELFGDMLEIRLKGVAHLSIHLMSIYCHLRGLEQVMLDMYEEPAMLHDAMAFLEEGHRQMLRQYEALNLLSLNNDGSYHSSGGVGYTDELPAPGFDPAHVRPCDMWASAESQELAQVSPEMHAEFALPYEKRLLEPFGLTGYGCCEDLTEKLDDVCTIPHLRRISISPWADVARCAEKLGNRVIFSWKPNPSYLVGQFDPEFIRRYICHTLDVAGNCVLEIILKDTHTCDWQPERFDAWTAIASELVGR